MKKIILLLFIPLFLSFTTIHKYYVALTEIEYDKKQQSVQFIMNVFIDDLEVCLNKDYSINAQISGSNEIENLDNYYINYLNEHFKVQINGEPKKYNFIGKEYKGNIVFFYLEIENISNVKKLQIKNTMLVKHFSDQQNLVKAKINGERKSLFLTKKNDKGLLKF